MATQLVEVIARMRQQSETRRADAERAAAQLARDAQRAGQTRARDDAAQQRSDRGVWSPANTDRWRREAAPQDLLTAWAAATTWAGHDPKAAAAMTRTEDEMRDRWPNVMDRYDRLRVQDGLHPASAMKTAVREAANAGWDPDTNPAATARPARAPQAALGAPDPAQAQAAPGPDASATPAQPRQWADNSADTALRWVRPAGADRPASTPVPTEATPSRPGPTAAPRRGR